MLNSISTSAIASSSANSLTVKTIDCQRSDRGSNHARALSFFHFFASFVSKYEISLLGELIRVIAEYSRRTQSYSA